MRVVARSRCCRAPCALRPCCPAQVVGEVVAVGSGVKELRPGMRAGVGWIRDSCRKCLACLRGEENVCEKGYTGLIVNGGCAGGWKGTQPGSGCFGHSTFEHGMSRRRSMGNGKE